MHINSVFLDSMNLSGLGEVIVDFFSWIFIILGFVILVLLLIALIYTHKSYREGKKSKNVLNRAIIMNIVFDSIYLI